MPLLGSLVSTDLVVLEDVLWGILIVEGWNVEKRKILRKIEQLEKRIATAKLVQASKEKGENDEGNVEELQKELEKWKRDEIYVNVSVVGVLGEEVVDWGSVVLS